jgi:hypothetical protein
MQPGILLSGKAAPSLIFEGAAMPFCNFVIT